MNKNLNMQYLPLVGTVILVHLLAVASPGPDFMMTVRNSLTYSRRTGIWTALGIGAGISVHVLYCAAGLAFIISQSILIFNFVKFLGAAYLIYIGIKSFFAKSSAIEVGPTKKKLDISWGTAFRIGFLTNVLNPKATVFFLSLFTLVISPATPIAMIILLGAIMVVNTALWFMLVAIFFTQSFVRSVFSKFQNFFNKIFGAILVGLGIKLAMSEK